MSEDKNELLTDHDYDGIKEYDNPLPTWWLATFFVTIIFGFIYWLHYSVAGGPTLKDELAESMAAIEQQAASHAPKEEVETEEQMSNQMKDSKYLAIGANVVSTKCAACHGPALGGMIGPNLTDNYWIHGKGTRMDIAKVVREGVPDKGMPPWGPVLSKDEIYGAVAFILSKKGSNPPNAKAPQGEKVE